MNLISRRRFGFGLLPILTSVSLEVVPKSADAQTPMSIGEIYRIMKEADISLSNGEQFNPLTYGTGVIIVNFWANWCSNCIEEFQTMQSVQAYLGPENLNIILVSHDKYWANDQAFISANNIPFVLGHFDPSQMPIADYASLMQASTSEGKVNYSLPLSYIISKHGTQIDVLVGRTDWQSNEMKTLLQQYLNS